MRLNQCIRQPEHMSIPYSHVVQEEKSDRKQIYEPPNEGWNLDDNGLGRYMTISRSELYWEGEAFTLWSNCSESCRDCINTKTGLAYRPILLPYDCQQTAAGSVFAIFHNSVRGNRENCIESLQNYYAKLEKIDERNTFILASILISIGSGCIIIIGLIWWWRKSHGMRLRQTLHRFSAQGRQDSANTINRRQIEDALPPQTGILGEPQCVVCIAPITKEQSARVLQCCHTFHDECIMEWWLREPRSELECPVCRRVQEGVRVDIHENLAAMVQREMLAQGLRRSSRGEDRPVPSQVGQPQGGVVDVQV